MTTDPVSALEDELLVVHPEWGVLGKHLSKRYYGRDGKPITFARWVAIMEKSPETRIVEQTNLPNGVLVSTVWLGMSHNFFGGATPLIFETMIFGEDWDSEYQERYATEAEAIAGHKRAVDLAREGHEFS